ncbi:hypothetical protein JTB14_006475 [Gonioctena quinquepunctata]|nr:hypothetical protein JTB14_006475 [Gonioctena quinquepunctata]
MTWTLVWFQELLSHFHAVLLCVFAGRFNTCYKGAKNINEIDQRDARKNLTLSFTSPAAEYLNEGHRWEYYDIVEKIYDVSKPHETYAHGDVNDNEIIFTTDEGDLKYLESTFDLPLLDQIYCCHEEAEKEGTNQKDSRNPTNNVSVLSEKMFDESGRNIEVFLLKIGIPEKKTKRKQRGVFLKYRQQCIDPTEKKNEARSGKEKKTE